jgi:hypothetical protein
VEFPTLARRLRRRRRFCSGAIVGLFVVIAGSEAIVAARAGFLTTTAAWIFGLGATGYVLFSLALFDGLMLFSLNRPGRVLRAMLPGLAVSLLSAYVLSHVFWVPLAAAGLVGGAALFSFDARRGVSEALRQADYAYYAA